MDKSLKPTRQSLSSGLLRLGGGGLTGVLSFPINTSPISSQDKMKWASPIRYLCNNK